MTKNAKTVAITLTVIGAALILYIPIFSQLVPHGSPTPTVRHQDGWARVTHKYLACSTQEKMNAMNAIFRSGDQEAWKRGAVLAIIAGECALLEPGDEVNITDAANYMSKVRKRGEVDAYWINSAELE